MRHTACFLALAALAADACADQFGSGADAFEIEFVTVGDPGNPADVTGVPNPAGSVDYSYRIGKYEISESIVEKAITAMGRPLDHSARGPDRPVTNITWIDAARVVNWLNTSTGHAPAYKFGGPREAFFELWAPGDDGYDPANPYRNTQAKYFFPTTDEWYKAAYYDPAAGVYYDYATGSNDLPDGIDFANDPDFEVVRRDGFGVSQPHEVTNAGVLSPYGTMGQTGNVVEMEESAYDLVNDSTLESRGARGGAYFEVDIWLDATWRGQVSPSLGGDPIGFRVASRVPEPGTLAAGLWAAATFLALRRRRSALLAR
ncbi:Formylglycine-generating sulfatase enzyme [Posidoniimonas corsicana]|uniref:Formylglycine-generating sulfatase enzyme n=1 Tax=Posidoniimonas corsicana TaxID=1938618 RepID=A0A5C5V337_9BACT|nr:SUMF1/EgtB/PvdO family nonheme iron enzyme [Posidoniimonas corsicana]TWT32420.1 Formylglycine-generating sulfatase enzyme [Posidoniimonas corsicana]